MNVRSGLDLFPFSFLFFSSPPCFLPFSLSLSLSFFSKRDQNDMHILKVRSIVVVCEIRAAFIERRTFVSLEKYSENCIYVCVCVYFCVYVLIQDVALGCGAIFLRRFVSLSLSLSFFSFFLSPFTRFRLLSEYILIFSLPFPSPPD